MGILITGNPEYGEESEKRQKVLQMCVPLLSTECGFNSQQWSEYEKHLVPISRCDFPAEYIQELQQKFSKTRRYRWEPLGWNSYAPDANLHVDPCNPSDDWLRALRVPVLHYGILLSREETEKYGTQCYHRQYTDEGEEAPKGAPPECSMPIVNYINSRLAEEVPGSPKELRFLSRQHVSGDDDDMICSLISTDKPHTWKSDQHVDRAVEFLRQVLQLPEDRKPMWYFDREFFGPQYALPSLKSSSCR